MQERKLQVKLETVTPLFLGGANPRGKPELRAPSFRGAMRFWLRALLGGVLGDNSQEIFKHESKIFGSTECASSVVVQIKQQEPQRPVDYSQISKGHQGIDYLFFGARLLERKALLSQTSFDCTIRMRAGVKDQRAMQAAIASLWLLTHLGGLGMRARKGGGNLQVVSTNWNDPSLPNLIIQAQGIEEPKELKEELQNGLSLLREWAKRNFKGLENLSFPNRPNFNVLHPDCCKIFIVNRQFNNWEEALNAFGKAMQQFRKRYDPDYKNVESVLRELASQGKKTKLQPVERAAFGLPIVFYFRSLNARATLEGKEHDRRASPLIVRVTKLKNGKCALVITRFYSPLLPADEGLQLRYGNRSVSTDQPSDAILGRFLSHLQNQLQGQVEPLLEVTDWWTQPTGSER